MDAAPSDDLLAERIARTTGEILMAIRGSALLSGKELGATGDSVAQAWIQQALSSERPADPVLSEEALDRAVRLGSSRVWVVDPLDGTREYSERRDDWCVHVALVVDGRPAAAAVARPAIGRVDSTASPLRMADAPPAPMRIVVSRTRPPAFVEELAADLGAELVPMGSAGAKVMAVLDGVVHAYVHAGGQYEWDSAAPVGVAWAAGLHASRLDGSPLVYNQPDPRLPDLVVCRPDLADPLLASIATIVG